MLPRAPANAGRQAESLLYGSRAWLAAAGARAAVALRNSTAVAVHTLLLRVADRRPACRCSCMLCHHNRALGFEPKKEEIKKMIADIDKDGRCVCVCLCCVCAGCAG